MPVSVFFLFVSSVEMGNPVGLPTQFGAISQTAAAVAATGIGSATVLLMPNRHGATAHTDFAHDLSVRRYV